MPTVIAALSHSSQSPPSLGRSFSAPSLQALFLLPGPIFKAVVIKHASSCSPGDVWRCLKTFLIVRTQGGGQRYCYTSISARAGSTSTPQLRIIWPPDVNIVKVEKPSFKSWKNSRVGELMASSTSVTGTIRRPYCQYFWMEYVQPWWSCHWCGEMFETQSWDCVVGGPDTQDVEAAHLVRERAKSCRIRSQTNLVSLETKTPE